jgi:hypothetical protein|tara:strand:- start:3599 stop:3832 length:234 start_codon:yes stop_codon:yes gene_type:complete
MKAAKIKKKIPPFVGRYINKKLDPEKVVTLYIRSFDRKLKDWALAHAHAQRKTLGEFFMEILKEYKKEASKRDSKRK